MKVFVASAMPTDYPLKLQKPSTVSRRVRDIAEEFILDSGIGDDVTTEELLELAERYDPEYVVAKDELHEHDTTIANTLALLDADPCADVLIPLQPPYREHYEKLREHIDVDAHSYVLGGMAVDDVGTREQLEWIRKFRRTAGMDVYAHGLGVGGGIEFVEAIAGTGLLDSVDCATPEMAAINGAVIDERLRQQETMAFGGGEGRCRRSYPLAEFNSWQVRDVWVREAERESRLGAF